MPENPYASPRSDFTAKQAAEVPQVEEGRPPVSVIVAWCTGFILIPMSLTFWFALGLIGIMLPIPLMAIVAMLLTRKPWVWRAAMLFFPLMAGGILWSVYQFADSRFAGMIYLLLPGMFLAGLICICLLTQSARDYYDRTKARQSV